MSLLAIYFGLVLPLFGGCFYDGVKVTIPKNAVSLTPVVGLGALANII